MTLLPGESTRTVVISSNPGLGSDRRYLSMVWSSLLLICLVAHGRALNSTFHYDDLHSIVDNPHIRSLTLIPTFFTDPGTFSGLPFGGMFRPLVMLSYSLTYAGAGLEPMWFAGTNLILHIGVVLLVFTLLRHLGSTLLRHPGSNDTIAWAAAALYAAHPINVETVAYFSSRSESMCALFMLLAILFHIRRPKAHIWLSAVSLGLALLCKSVAIVVIPLLWIYESWFVGQPPVARARLLWPLGVVGVGYLWIMRELLSTTVLLAPVRSASAQLLTQVKALIYYLHLLTVPWGLNVEHQFEIGHPDDLTVWASAIVLISVGSLLLRATAPVRWWMLWSVLILAPTLIVPLNVLVNEHRLYLVSVAFTMLLAGFLISSGLRVRRIGLGLLIVMVLLSYQRGAVWADSAVLWQDALDKAPMMPRPHLFVGDAHFHAGRNPQALAEYDLALSVNPGQLSAADQLVLHNNRGAALLGMGAFDRASQAYERALLIDADYAPALAAVEGLRAVRHSQETDAAAASRKAGLTAMMAGDLDAAISHLRHSLTLVSESGTWLVLGSLYERVQQWDEAAIVYRSLMSDPKQATRATARQRLEVLSRQRQAPK